ncbi:hypothetical protein ACWEAO_07285 [Micrococcus luteus]|uniref:hypothetical protein n=1 Tax=Micrococcus luteus TaxID=1270 RepID=UPI00365BFABB
MNNENIIQRANLTPYIIISLLVGVLLVAWGLSLSPSNPFISSLVTSIGSSSVSAGVALMITDWLIKPIQTKQLIEMTGLSHRVHELGVRNLRNLRDLPPADLFGSGAITVACNRWIAKRILRDLARATKGKKVEIYMSICDADAKFALELGDEWRNIAGVESSQILRMYIDRDHHQALAVRSEDRIIASIPTLLESEQQDPPLLVFDRSASEEFLLDLNSLMDEIVGSGETPAFSSN